MQRTLPREQCFSSRRYAREVGEVYDEGLEPARGVGMRRRNGLCCGSDLAALRAAMYTVAERE